MRRPVGGRDTPAVDTAALNRCSISDILMREMRSSAIFLGAILARCGRADISYPGGCELGPGPLICIWQGCGNWGRRSGRRAASSTVPLPDCGGGTWCCAFLLWAPRRISSRAACGAEGTTVLSNAAREPEIEDLQNFLNACGGDVRGAGTSTVVIRGGRTFHGGTYRVMPDRIAAATYLCALASAGGTGFIRGAREEHLATVTAVLREAGCEISSGPEGIACICRERLRAVRPVRTAPYPGFPTDARRC